MLICTYPLLATDQEHPLQRPGRHQANYFMSHNEPWAQLGHSLFSLLIKFGEDVHSTTKSELLQISNNPFLIFGNSAFSQNWTISLENHGKQTKIYCVDIEKFLWGKNTSQPAVQRETKTLSCFCWFFGCLLSTSLLFFFFRKGCVGCSELGMEWGLYQMET